MKRTVTVTDTPEGIVKVITITDKDSFKEDEPVIATRHGKTVHAHFSHWDSNGYPHIFQSGRTSWTNETAKIGGTFRVDTVERP